MLTLSLHNEDLSDSHEYIQNQVSVDWVIQNSRIFDLVRIRLPNLVALSALVDKDDNSADFNMGNMHECHSNLCCDLCLLTLIRNSRGRS